MKLLRRSVLALAVVVSAAGGAPAQSSDEFFNPEALQRIDIWLNGSDWNKLRAAFQENTYYPADVTWNGQTVYNVGIRSRGLGSRSATKPGLRVDFDRYAGDQTFLGLKSFVLDNLTQDFSGIKETLAMRFFARLGIPAPRETHTMLYVNGTYAGLYALVESVDKTMMGRVFGSIGDDVQNDGYLFEYNYVLGNPWRFAYEGSSLESYKQRFSAKTHESQADSTIWGPIEEFVRVVNETSSTGFEQEVSAKLDFTAFVRYLAAQNFIAQNDGFAGYDGMNNFYMYRLEDSDINVFIAWDEDNAFQASDFQVDTRLNDNMLTRRTMDTPGLNAQYYSVLLEAAASATDWMRAEMERQFAMIAPAMQADNLKPYSNEQYEAERERLLTFAPARITYVTCEVARATGATLPPVCTASAGR